jgi:hypothetical protein
MLPDFERCPICVNCWAEYEFTVTEWKLVAAEINNRLYTYMNWTHKIDSGQIPREILCDKEFNDIYEKQAREIGCLLRWKASIKCHSFDVDDDSHLICQ